MPPCAAASAFLVGCQTRLMALSTEGILATAGQAPQGAAAVHTREGRAGKCPGGKLAFSPRSGPGLPGAGSPGSASHLAFPKGLWTPPLLRELPSSQSVAPHLFWSPLAPPSPCSLLNGTTCMVGGNRKSEKLLTSQVWWEASELLYVHSFIHSFMQTSVHWASPGTAALCQVQHQVHTEVGCCLNCKPGPKFPR